MLGISNVSLATIFLSDSETHLGNIKFNTTEKDLSITRFLFLTNSVDVDARTLGGSPLTVVCLNRWVGKHKFCLFSSLRDSGRCTAIANLVDRRDWRDFCKVQGLEGNLTDILKKCKMVSVFTSSYVNTETILHFFYKMTKERGTKTVLTYARVK